MKRIVFNHAAVELAASIPIELSPGESLLLLSPDRDDVFAGKTGEILRRDYGVATFPMPYMQGRLIPGEEGHDILTDEGAAMAAERISGMASLAGMIIALPQGGSGKLTSMADVSQLLRRLFLSLKAFLQSPKKKFVLLIHYREDTETFGPLLAEGMLGLFLSAALEYPSVQFRTLEIESDTDLHVALRNALDRGCPVVELIHRDGRVFTSQGESAPSLFEDSPALKLNAGDVVVMSGGQPASAPTWRPVSSPSCPVWSSWGERLWIKAATGRRRSPGPWRICTPRGSRQRTIPAMLPTPKRSAGSSARWQAYTAGSTGSFTAPESSGTAYLSQMTQDDFSTVTDVKFLGAWNLFSAAEGAGLRFFVGLSSGAAIQGNPGQGNYAAANRMMSALLRTLHRKNSAIRFKALMLPPVEGAGMADDPEIRALLKRMGVAYIHANELAGLFCRELFTAPADDVWVMFMRRLPSVKTALLDDTTPAPLGGELTGGAVSMNPAEFPMIERISRLDIRREELEAFRSFSPEKDLWIADHRPFKFVKHPLVSAAMILETFMEAARILYPHLQVRGVHGVRLIEMIECPPGVPRPAMIILPPDRQRPSGGTVRPLTRNTGYLTRREIDRPLHPALHGPGDPRWRSRISRGSAPGFSRTAGRIADGAHGS